MCPLTGCNNERQSFAKLSYSAIDNVLPDQSASSRFAGLLSGVQHLECDDNSKQDVGVLPKLNSPLILSLGSSAANFLVPQILAHEDANTQLVYHPVVSDDVT